MIKLVAVVLLLSMCSLVLSQPGPKRPGTWPGGYWPLEKSQPIIEKTQTIRLSPDLSQLSAGEKSAVAKLLEVGKIFQRIYEDQRHHQALSSYEKLWDLHMHIGNPTPTENLLTLYRLFQGPIATTLENKREPFLPVDPVVPGKNMYPWGVTKDQVDAFVASHPDQREEIMDQRSVVHTANSLNANADLAKLLKYPALDTLHPELKAELQAIARGGAPTRGALRVQGLYSVPYSVAYADELMRAYTLLNQAAGDLHKDDEEFAKFLRNRARDLLSDDY